MPNSIIFGLSWQDIIVLFSIYLATEWIIKYGKNSTKGRGDFIIKLTGLTLLLSAISYIFLGVFTIPSIDDLSGNNFFKQKLKNYQSYSKSKPFRMNNTEEPITHPEIKNYIKMHTEKVSQSDSSFKMAKYKNAVINIPKNWVIEKIGGGIGIKVKPPHGALQCILRTETVDSTEHEWIAIKFGKNATQVMFESTFKSLGFKPKIIQFLEDKEEFLYKQKILIELRTMIGVVFYYSGVRIINKNKESAFIDCNYGQGIYNNQKNITNKIMDSLMLI